MGDVNLNAAHSFRCKACDRRAEIHMRDDILDSVRCPTCRAAVRGEEAHSMYSELRNRFVIQKGRQVAREVINKTKNFRVPMSHVANEYSDERWPFILEVEQIN